MTRPETFVDRAWRGIAHRLQAYAGSAARRTLDRELARLGLSGVKEIHTWTRPGELEALYTLARELPPEANIVELGSYLGASTCHLAAGAAARHGRVTAIDLWNNETIYGDDRDTFDQFRRNIAPVADRVRVVRKRTQDLMPEDIQPPVHLAFIDADHSYEATKSDAAFLAPHIAPGGLIAFHDATTFAGVGQAVAEMLASGDWCIGGKVESLVWIRRSAWSPWPLVAPPTP